MSDCEMSIWSEIFETLNAYGQPRTDLARRGIFKPKFARDMDVLYASIMHHIALRRSVHLMTFLCFIHSYREAEQSRHPIEDHYAATCASQRLCDLLLARHHIILLLIRGARGCVDPVFIE